MIKIENARFSYGNKVIFRDFSLELPKTGITALQGPSGCGKTTLLRLLTGLERLESGEITGISSRDAAFLFQENRLLSWRNVRQHITDVMPRTSSVPPEFYLELVELGEEGRSLPRELSGGMGRRLALARCLALERPVLLLDEPFAGVDPERAKRILSRIRNLGKTVILVSHQEAILAETDRIFSFSGPPISYI